MLLRALVVNLLGNLLTGKKQLKQVKVQLEQMKEQLEQGQDFKAAISFTNFETQKCY